MDQPVIESRLKSFAEFWPHYVREHAHPVNRILHFIGSTLGFVCLVETLLTANFWFVPLGLLIGYGFAWTGHFFIEHNRPATFQYPIWSLRADWKMWSLILIRQMKNEVHKATSKF